MPELGPQQFDIPVDDQLFQTLNPDDPIIGIAVGALVPVTVPWNLERTELTKDVVFGPTRWTGAGPGPHDMYEERLGGKREKIGTVTWTVDTTCTQLVQTNGDQHRWLVTPCPILSRTFTPLSGAPQITEVMKNPQPCPGNWVPTPPAVTAALAHSLRQPKLPAAPGGPVKSPKAKPRKK